jgi:hypothetical protein
MELNMQTFKTVLFISLSIGTLIFVTFSLLGWSVKEVLILLLIGLFFVGGSIWLYKEAYREDE